MKQEKNNSQFTAAAPRQAARPAASTAVRAAPPAAGSVRPPPPARSGAITEARLTTVNAIDPIPAEYALLKA